MSVPVSRILAGYVIMPVVMVYFCVCSLELIKSTIGFILVKKGVWVRNIVNRQ